MNRRDLFKNSLAMSALALGRGRLRALPTPVAEFPKAPGLTKYVAELYSVVTMDRSNSPVFFFPDPRISIVIVARASHRASAPALGCPRPQLLARVQKTDSLAKMALTGTGPLVSKRRAAADTGRLLRTEAKLSSPTWGAFDETDSHRDPFSKMTSSREIVCRLALGYTDNPREIFIILYTLPDDTAPRIPTLAHAVSVYVKDGVTKAGWHQHFSPTTASAPSGRTRPVAPYRCEKGVPETVHDPVPPDYIHKTRRMTYA